MTGSRYNLFLCTALLTFIQDLSSQVTVTIPTANSHSTVVNTERRKPLGTYDGYERTAFIFRHSEIGQYGLINSIAFYCDSINNPGSAPVKIFMKERTDSFFVAATTVANEESGAQLVYSGTLSASSFAKGQWAVINFSNFFNHATSRPVEVIIETNAGGSGNETAPLAKSFYHYPASTYSYSTQYWDNDNTPPANAGIRSFYRPNVQFNISVITSCSGAPIAGTTISDVDTTCSSVSLSLQGGTAATGLSYQWRDSTAGGAWTDISSANFSSLTTSITSDTWFRCIVKCGSQKDSSSVKKIILRNYLQCICVYNLGGGCGLGGYIDSVAIETTNLVTSHTGCSANNYTQYPISGTNYAQLTSGQSYNLHTRFNGNVIASAWVDYDENGQFDASEWVQICTTSKSDSDYVTALNVPVAAKNGLTILRIRSRDAGNSNDSLDACSNFGSGETEDYFVGINYNIGITSQNNFVNDVLLYPNPANNLVSVRFNFVPPAQTQLQIFSVDGNLVKNYSGTIPNEINVSVLENGIYFLKFSSPGLSIVKKLSISR